MSIRITAHVLAKCTARDPRLADELGPTTRHRTPGSGWLVVPVKEPAGWRDGDADRLSAGLVELQRTDYHRIADLGRFFVGEEPYYVR